MARLNDLEVDEYLARCVEIDPLGLQEEYVRLPADLAYQSSRYAQAYREAARAKSARKRLGALLAIEHRARLQLDGRATEAMVEAAVETDPRMQTAEDREIDAEVERQRLYGIVDAVRAKKDMLVSIGAHVRAEMGADPTVRAAHAAMRAGKNDPLSAGDGD